MQSHARLWPIRIAALWAFVCLVAAVVYHINEPTGVLSVTYDGRTYTGNPPATTLFERDRMLVFIMAVVVAVAILIAFIDVAVRGRRNVASVGIATAITGAVLVAFSLFGLLWGLASVGVVGLLLILASRPGVTTVAALVGSQNSNADVTS